MRLNLDFDQKDHSSRERTQSAETLEINEIGNYNARAKLNKTNPAIGGLNMNGDSQRGKLKPFSKHYLAIAKEHEERVRQLK